MSEVYMIQGGMGMTMHTPHFKEYADVASAQAAVASDRYAMIVGVRPLPHYRLQEAQPLMAHTPETGWYELEEGKELWR